MARPNPYNQNATRLFGIDMPKGQPFTQQGVGGPVIVGGFLQDPDRNAKVRGWKKYQTYADILANITTIAAGVRYFLTLLAKPSWSFEPADKSPAAQEAADFMEEVFDELNTPWSAIVKRAGLYRFYGFSIQEWIAFKRDDGRVGLEDIEQRPQRTIWRWDVDDTGEILGVTQRHPVTGRELALPRSKMLYIVDNVLSDTPEGLGLLRHLVDGAERLEEYLYQESTGFLRDLRGIPIGRAPIAELQAAVKAGQIKQVEMDVALENLRSFVRLEKKIQNTALILSSQPYLNKTDSGDIVAGTNKWGLELVSGNGPGLQEVGVAIERINHEMARLLGTEGMLLGASSAGSLAMAREKNNVLFLNANSCLAEIRHQAQRDIINTVWSLNGFDDALMPMLKNEQVDMRNVDEITSALKDMAAAGAPMMPDDEGINFVRDLLGMPQVDLTKMAALEGINIDQSGSSDLEDDVAQTDTGDQVDTGGAPADNVKKVSLQRIPMVKSIDRQVSDWIEEAEEAGLAKQEMLANLSDSEIIIGAELAKALRERLNA